MFVDEVSIDMQSHTACIFSGYAHSFTHINDSQPMDELHESLPVTIDSIVDTHINHHQVRQIMIKHD